MREVKIGDRFLDKMTNCGDTWEITGYGRKDLDHFRCVCIDPGELDVTTGTEREFSFNQYRWEYLGNFSKANNFQNLYEILLDNP